MTVSTLQRQKAAFSTKLQNFKVMMARIGFAQVPISNYTCGSVLSTPLVHLLLGSCNIAQCLCFNTRFSHASMTQASIIFLIIDNHSFTFEIVDRLSTTSIISKVTDCHTLKSS